MNKGIVGLLLLVIGCASAPYCQQIDWQYGFLGAICGCSDRTGDYEQECWLRISN